MRSCRARGRPAKRLTTRGRGDGSRVSVTRRSVREILEDNRLTYQALQQPHENPVFPDCGDELVETASTDQPRPSHGPQFVGKSPKLVGRPFLEITISTGDNKLRKGRITS